ncbi:MAG: hypothetical protein DMG26_20150 [Acidobacteria bacterium]|nr:MAG: hypothetical protein DMG26_20150 [Acidobacteriota bacterium]
MRPLGADDGGSEMQNEIVRFGEFDANLTTGELYFRGIRRSMEYRAFQLFSLLVRQPGELVTNGEIERFIWPDEQAIYDEPSMKRRIISAAFGLRSALGGLFKWFERVPRRGYRWIGRVQTRESWRSQEFCPYCGAAVNPEPKEKGCEKSLVAVAGGARRARRNNDGYLSSRRTGWVRKVRRGTRVKNHALPACPQALNPVLRQAVLKRLPWLGHISPRMNRARPGAAPPGHVSSGYSILAILARHCGANQSS